MVALNKPFCFEAGTPPDQTASPISRDIRDHGYTCTEMVVDNVRMCAATEHFLTCSVALLPTLQRGHSID